MLIRDDLRQAIALSLESIDVSRPRQTLTAIGDALRARIAIAPPILRGVEAIATADVAAAVVACTSDVAGYSTEMLAERDLVESFRVGLQRWAIAHQVTPFEIDGVAELADALAAFDARLAAAISRSTAESRLDARAALLGEHPWTAALSDDGAAAAADGSVSWDPAMSAAEPSDAVLAKYIRDGASASSVEGFAARVPDFVETLALLIEAAREDRDQVSLVARRWHRDRRSAGAPLAMPELPRATLAAATDADGVAGSRSVQLGALGVAQGRLVLTATRARLIVHAPLGALRSVELGTNVATATDAGAGTQKWTAASNIAGPLRLRIVNADGSIAFDDLLELTDHP